MFKKVLDRRSFLLKCCPDRYKPKYKGALEFNFPVALRYVPNWYVHDWFATAKMLKDLDNGNLENADLDNCDT